MIITQLRRRSHTPHHSDSTFSSSTTDSSATYSTSHSTSNSSSQPVPLWEITKDIKTRNDNKQEENNEQTVTCETIDEHIDDIMKSITETTESNTAIATHTRMDTALAAISEEELAQFVQDKPKRADSMRRKEQWVMTLYEPWCVKTNKGNPFPLEEKNICGFIRFMAIKCGYTLKGIELIVVPCLKHLSFDATGRVDPRIFALLKEEIKALRHNPDVIKEGEGKPPLCYFDVAELVRRMPNNVSFKAEEASLFLFALHTGSRALTCEGIKYKDILFYERDDTTRAVRIIINQAITKGNPNWNHPVCVEGFTEIENPLDVVYYLNQHCMRAVGMTLEQIVQRNEGEPNPFDDNYVWPFKRDAMRERLKTRLLQSGFPAGRWSFHSLRSGHICSCLLIAGADAGRKAAVLETSSITAGWKMYGTSQRRYIKKVAERTIVSSRLVGAGIGLYLPTTQNVQSAPAAQSNNDQNVSGAVSSSSSSEGTEEQSKFVMNLSSTVAAEGFVHAPHSTEAFHLIQLKKENFPPGLFMRDFRQRFDQYFMAAIGAKEDKKNYCQNCFNRLMTIWGGKIAESRNEKASYRIKRKLGRQLTIKMLVEDRRDTWQLADEMIQELVSYGIDPNDVPKKKCRLERQEELNQPARPTALGRTQRVSRRRKKWTEEEDKELCEAKKNGIKFPDIIDKLPDRLLKDLYPRWKQLVKKNPDLKQYE